MLKSMLPAASTGFGKHTLVIIRPDIPVTNYLAAATAIIPRTAQSI